MQYIKINFLQLCGMNYDVDPEELKEEAKIFDKITKEEEKKECWKHYKV